MRRYVALAVGIVLLTACGADGHERAASYAKQACAYQPPEPGDAPTKKLSDVPEMLRREKNSASLAAQAAKLDPRWNELNRAYSTLVDVLTFIASLPTNGSPATDEQNTEAHNLGPSNEEAMTTVRAECRKALA